MLGDARQALDDLHLDHLDRIARVAETRGGGWGMNVGRRRGPPAEEAVEVDHLLRIP